MDLQHCQGAALGAFYGAAPGFRFRSSCRPDVRAECHAPCVQRLAAEFAVRGASPLRGGRRPCDRGPGASIPRGGPVSHHGWTRSAAATPTGPRSAIAVPKGLVRGSKRGSKLVDGSAVSCGCWRADSDVRQAARMTMPAFDRVFLRARAGGTITKGEYTLLRAGSNEAYR